MKILQIFAFFNKLKSTVAPKSITNVSFVKVNEVETNILEEWKKNINSLTLWQLIYVFYCVVVRLTNHNWKSVWRQIKEYFKFW